MRRQSNNRRLRREILIYSKGFAECVKRISRGFETQDFCLSAADTRASCCGRATTALLQARWHMRQRPNETGGLWSEVLLRHSELSGMFQVHKSFHCVFQLRVTFIGDDHDIRHQAFGIKALLVQAQRVKDADLQQP
jgi:hypothetical protein